MPILSKNVRLLDTSIYDTRIRDNLLFLDSDLANDVSFFDQLNRSINDSVESNLTIITKSSAESLSQWLQRNSDSFVCPAEFVQMLTNTSVQFRTALLKHKKKMGIDWVQILKKAQEISTIMGTVPKSAIPSS